VREEIFNRIGGIGAFTDSANAKDCDLSPFLPKKIKQTDWSQLAAGRVHAVRRVVDGQGSAGPPDRFSRRR
jgi:hypothetical protein